MSTSSRLTSGLCLAGALLLLPACQKDDPNGTGSAPQVPMASAEAIAKHTAAAPWLREHLPADTIAYLRLPSPWGLLAAPSGRASDPVYANAAHIEAWGKIRSALVADPLLKELTGPTPALLDAMASPLEVAVVAQGKLASPAAHVLISVQLRVSDAAQAAELLAASMPEGMPAPVFDADGHAELQAGQAKLLLHFDRDARRLRLLTGMFANGPGFRTLLEEVDQPPRVHPMHAQEQRIDAFGQGLLLWLDMAAMRPLLQGGLSPEQAWLQPVLEQANGLVLGWGSAQGRGQMGLRVAFDSAPWGAYLRSGPQRFDALASGQPQMVSSGILPTGEQMLAAMTAIANLQAEPGQALTATELEAQIAKLMNLSLSEAMKPFAGPWLYVSDDAGSWQALRLADPAALQALVAAMVERGKARHRTHTHAGVELHHLAIHSVLPAADASTDPSGDADAAQAQLLQRLTERMPSNLYWYQQGDWLYLAQVPQPLLERLDRGAEVNVADWLQQTQASGRESALLSYSTQAEGIARLAYAVQLEIVQAAGDLSGAQLDLFSLPTAQQLGLPEHTSMGVEVGLSATELSLQANYELTPLEGLGSGSGMGAVAVVGILAAIAVPAYQDYTVRAKASQGLAAAAVLKLTIAEHYAATGELPEESELGLELPLTMDDPETLVVYDSGAVLVQFGSSAPTQLADQYVYLLPAVRADGGLSWVCGYAAETSGEDLLVSMNEGVSAASVEARYLPGSCRSER